MKNTYVLILSLLLIRTNAQSIHSPTNPKPFGLGFFYMDPWIGNLNSEGKKIKQLKCTSTKYKDVDITILNEGGQTQEIIYTNRWSIGPFMFKDFNHAKYAYENGELTKIENLDKKGVQQTLHIYEYAFQHQIKHSQAFKKGKRTGESFTVYNADSTQKEQSSYKTKNNANYLTSRYEFEYYPDKQRKQTRSYNRKNKLRHIWNYECDPKGKIEKKETKICVNTGDMNGKVVEVTFAENSKGKKTKYVNSHYKYNGKKVRTNYEVYVIKNGKEIKQMDTHYADSLEPYYCYRSYDKHGKVNLERRTDYSIYMHGKQQISKEVVIGYSKNKISSRWEITYNEKGLPAANSVYNRKGKCIGKAEYKYEGDHRYAISHYNKKQKLTSVYSGELTYY